MIKTILRKMFIVFRSQGIITLVSKGISKLIEKIIPRYPHEHLIIYKVLVSLAKSGTMLDVGAETGVSLAPFANSNWTIHAFEPDTRSRDILKKLFGDYINVFIDSRAVSNVNQENVSFYASKVSTGISSLHSFDTSHFESEKVNTITLAKYLEDVEIDAIDFLKIDTEGFDLQVLEGFPWEKHQPIVVECEFDNQKTTSLGYSWADTARFLSLKGYKVIVSEWGPIVVYGGNYRWQNFKIFPCDLKDPNAWGNLIAVLDDKIFDRILAECQKFERRWSLFNKP
jgi:FkbM family methyltransferase